MVSRTTEGQSTWLSMFHILGEYSVNPESMSNLFLRSKFLGTQTIPKKVLMGGGETRNNHFSGVLINIKQPLSFDFASTD